MRRLHHTKVVSVHDTILHVLLTTQLLPAIAAKVRPVVEQPLHGRWVLVLSWRRPRVAGVTSDAFSAPDGVCLDWLDGALGLVVAETPDGSGEVGEEPLRGLGWVAGAEETDFVEEDVEAGGEGVEVDGAR